MVELCYEEVNPEEEVGAMSNIKLGKRNKMKTQMSSECGERQREEKKRLLTTSLTRSKEIPPARSYAARELN